MAGLGFGQAPTSLMCLVHNKVSAAHTEAETVRCMRKAADDMQPATETAQRAKRAVQLAARQHIWYSMPLTAACMDPACSGH